MKNGNFIETFLKESQETIEKLPREDVDKIFEILYEAWKNEKSIFVIGNGGSASTASHFAADLAKAAIVPGKKRFKAFALTDNFPLISSWINDTGYENSYVGPLENLLQKNDVIVAISVYGGDGRSGNLIKALEYGKNRGAKTIGLIGFDGGFMKDIVDAHIIVPANSQPIVESMHVLLHHLLVFGVKEKIKNET